MIAPTIYEAWIVVLIDARSFLHKVDGWTTLPEGITWCSITFSFNILPTVPPQVPETVVCGSTQAEQAI